MPFVDARVKEAMRWRAAVVPLAFPHASIEGMFVH